MGRWCSRGSCLYDSTNERLQLGRCGLSQYFLHTLVVGLASLRWTLLLTRAADLFKRVYCAFPLPRVPCGGGASRHETLELCPSAVGVKYQAATARDRGGTASRLAVSTRSVCLLLAVPSRGGAFPGIALLMLLVPLGAGLSLAHP